MPVNPLSDQDVNVQCAIGQVLAEMEGVLSLCYPYRRKDTRNDENLHAFPSGLNKGHFAQLMTVRHKPFDRLGYAIFQ